MVDWAGAAAYARHEAERTGLPWQLPPELAWEKAARGVDGRRFPWGDAFDPSWACMKDSHRGQPKPVAVDAIEADVSVYGIRGLCGNIKDWCADAWSVDGPPLADARVPAAPPDPTADPPGRTRLRVRRGGAGLGARHPAGRRPRCPRRGPPRLRHGLPHRPAPRRRAVGRSGGLTARRGRRPQRRAVEAETDRRSDEPSAGWSPAIFLGYRPRPRSRAPEPTAMQSYHTTTDRILTIRFSGRGHVARRRSAWGGQINAWGAQRLSGSVYIVPKRVTIDEIDALQRPPAQDAAMLFPTAAPARRSAMRVAFGADAAGE